MNVFELCASLVLDTSNYKSELSNASNETSNFGSGISGGLSTAVKAGGVALAGMATAVAGVSAGMGKAVSDVAEYGDNIDKSSQKLGISAEAYQEWDAVLQHSGTSMSSMKSTFKTLSNAVQDGSDDQIASFQKLGLSMDDLQNMSTEEVFQATITGLQGMEEGTERTAIATDLLGKGATELGALLNTSSEDTQAMLDKVNELGGVMSDDAVSASARYEDSLQDLQTAFSGVKNNLTAEFLPAIADVMDGLTAIMTGDSGGVEQVKQGIENVATTIETMMPKITEVIQEIMPLIVDVITEALPLLVECAVQIILALVDALIDNLPELIECAVTLITALATGLIEALPELIKATPKIVKAIVKALIENAPLILNAGGQLIVELGKGLVAMLPDVVKKIPTIVSKIVSAFKEKISEFNSIGKNIVSGLWEGIKNSWKVITNGVSKLLDGLVSGVKTLLGIHSPSRVFASIGGYMAEGMGEGWDDKFGDVQKTINGNLDFSGQAVEMPTLGVASSNSTSDNSLDYLTDAIKNALDSYEIKWNDRQLGRMVRSYA